MKNSDLTGKVILLLTNSKLPEAWRENGAQALRDVFEDAGYQTDLTLCDDPKKICDCIANETNPGDIVVVGGGDGTMNAVLDTVIENKVVLLPLPLGTANDFARTLTLPDEPLTAARAAIHGQITMLDIGQVNDQTFVNAASIGVPADARHRIDPELKRTFGAISYAVANWKSWQEMTPMELSVSCGDEEPQQLTLRQLTVTNGRYFGGGLRPSENTRPDDGSLHVFAIRDTVDTLSGMDIAAELLFGSVNDSNYAMTMQCDKISIKGNDGAPILADGEIISKLPADFTLHPAILPVFAPNTFFDLVSDNASKEGQADIPQRALVNDIACDTQDLAIRLGAIVPVAKDETLKAACHDGARHLRDISRQFELTLRPYGLPTTSPDPDLHSLEELRDRVMGWLLDNADTRLATGLKTRCENLLAEIDDLDLPALPDELQTPMRTLNDEIGHLSNIFAKLI